MKKLIPGICLLLLSSILFSQTSQPESYCGYHEKSEWLTEYQKNPAAFPQKKSGAITYLPMTIHVLGTDEGSGYFGEKAILDAFCTLNADFAEADIQFYFAGDFNYINNTDWFVHDFRDGRDMMSENFVAGTVNTFFVEDPAGNCGYYSPGQDALAVRKSCSGPSDHTWAHEVGHYLSLPHPFVGWEGESYQDYDVTLGFVGNRQIELVDGTNCENAADGFCDTPPDYISDRWTCNGNGLSSEITDPLGMKFRADGSIIMGYANDACASRFTGEQIGAMNANINSQRRDLLQNPTPLEEIDLEDGLVALSPANGEAVVPGDVMVRWEPVKNATSYLIEVYGLPVFNPLLHRAIVKTNQALVPDMTRERAHYWRIRPFNEFHACGDFSELKNFVVSSSVSAKYISDVETFAVSPVPAASGSQFSIELSSKNAFEGQAKLVNLTGQILSTKTYQISAGFQNLRFDLPEVPQGIYLLSLENGSGERIVKKVVVN